MKKLPSQGVLYPRQEYAGLFRRLLTMAIDFTVVAGVFLSVESVSYTSDWGMEYFFWIMLLFFYLYLIEMKRRIGSIGNLVTSTRLVGLDGQKPSRLSMITRSAFWMLGLLFIIADILWLTGDSRRQMIRDKFTGIYVIRKGAKPVATGKILYKNYMFLGLNFILKEIQEADSTKE